MRTTVKRSGPRQRRQSFRIATYGFLIVGTGAVGIGAGGIGAGGLSARASSNNTATGASTTTVEAVPETVPAGKGRTVVGLPTSGTTIPAAPGKYKLVPIASAQQPLAVAVRPSDKAMFVVEKTGKVRSLNGKTIGPAVLDLTATVSTTNEQGLLGLAFHPSDPTRLFVDYTDKQGAIVVAEFTASGEGEAWTIAPASQRIVLRIPKPFKEHNAGTIVFDSSGALLIGTGDGGGSGDPKNHAQRTDSLLGKLLRILPDAVGSKPYSIPADNPFANTKQQLGSSTKPPRPEIFASGLRNPWRISVDRQTKDVWVPDVGQANMEEINRIAGGVGGQNFGWRNREGTSAYIGARPAKAVDPLYAYLHVDKRCAVVGGFVYRGTALPALSGWYLFGDVCSGEVMALNPNKKWRPTSLGIKLTYLTAFAEDPNGEPLVMSFEGPIARLSPA